MVDGFQAGVSGAGFRLGVGFVGRGEGGRGGECWFGDGRLVWCVGEKGENEMGVVTTCWLCGGLWFGWCEAERHW